MMPEVNSIRLSQKQEKHATLVSRSQLTYRYAYARSADSRATEDNGQDYLAIQEDGEHLAFALCDGVSQSFMGDLAAQLLGDELVAWFWNRRSGSENLEALHHELINLLNHLSGKASLSVQNFELPANLSPLVRDVLERKRNLGSESIFAAGLISIPTDRLLLAWMGDSRIRFWGSQTERTSELGETFHTEERWSTRRGTVGQVHIFQTSLQNVHRIAAYSDGIALLDQKLQRSIDNEALDRLIAYAAETPESDDISFLEIRLSPAFQKTERLTLPAPAHIGIGVQSQTVFATWQAIPEATQYEVELRNSQAYRWTVENPAWQQPCHSLPTSGMLYVRAWSNDIHGAWSDPVALPQPDEVQPDAYSSLPDKQTPQNEPSLISIGTAGITETTSRFRSSILYLIPILAIMLIGVVFLVGISFRGAAGTLDSTIPTEEILEKVGPDHRQPLFSPETITPSVTVAPSITVAPIITETATAQPPVIPTPTSTGVPIITETATAQPPVIPTPTSTGVPTNTQREQGSVINQ